LIDWQWISERCSHGDRTIGIAAGIGGFVINGSAPVTERLERRWCRRRQWRRLADLIVGAPDGDPRRGSAAGRSYVVFGKTVAPPSTSRRSPPAVGGFVINGQCG
jgi:hypothetical protein